MEKKMEHEMRIRVEGFRVKRMGFRVKGLGFSDCGLGIGFRVRVRLVVPLK